MSPLNGDQKSLQNKDLATGHNIVDRETDSKRSNQAPKQAEIDTQNLPPDLAEVVAVWPELPEYIKAAIKALVRTHNSKDAEQW